MSRKHFRAIADAIKAERSTTTDPAALEALDRVAQALAFTLASTNDRFDRSRFLAACGVETI